MIFCLVIFGNMYFNYAYTFHLYYLFAAFNILFLHNNNKDLWNILSFAYVVLLFFFSRLSINIPVIISPAWLKVELLWQLGIWLPCMYRFMMNGPRKWQTWTQNGNNEKECDGKRGRERYKHTHNFVVLVIICQINRWVGTIQIANISMCSTMNARTNNEPSVILCRPTLKFCNR